MRHLKTYMLFESKTPSELEKMGYTLQIVRDEDDEGTFAEIYHPTEKDINGNPLNIAHLHVPDDNIGHKFWQAGDVYVHENYRRIGLGTWMYIAMSKELEKQPEPATWQSPGGKAMWKVFSDRYDDYFEG